MISCERIKNMKKQKLISIPEKEYKRLKRLDERQIQMKPLIMQLANLVRQKKNG